MRAEGLDVHDYVVDLGDAFPDIPLDLVGKGMGGHGPD